MVSFRTILNIINDLCKAFDDASCIKWDHRSCAGIQILQTYCSVALYCNIHLKNFTVGFTFNGQLVWYFLNGDIIYHLRAGLL